MRSRWQLFTSNLLVFVAWYVLVYSMTTGPTGVLTALAGALVAVAVGLFAGVFVGAVAHAIDLHLTHRDVRAGDAHDGARITLGKLPERAVELPVMPASAAPEPPAADPASASKPAPSPAIEPARPPAAPTGSTAPPSPDQLAIACDEFARGHEGVFVKVNCGEPMFTGVIDCAEAPADFAAFLALIGDLANAGVDVSGVQVTQDTSGVPVSVAFPLSVSGVVQP